MATISTHTLNSVDGTHAGGIALSVIAIAADQSRKTLLTGETDSGGRFVQEVAAADIDIGADYELVLLVAPYFESCHQGDAKGRSLKEVVVRFQMPDPEGRYHMPFMLAPNSYSVWSSR
ncbi:MAG: hypothetical protein GKR97_09915 [Rhizobiaceae bacterium]|nr:hypothetical protein [Rhizobiaceae bacterium]